MSTNDKEEAKPQRQTADNPSGEPISNPPSENKQPAEKDTAGSTEALDKEQEFKEAQSERD